MGALGIISTTVADGPNKVFIGGLPYNLTEDNVKELLSAFGALKSFHLVKEAGAPQSKGYGFCEYADSKNTQQAVIGLNGMSIGDKTLTVRLNNQSGASSNIYGGAVAVPAPPPTRPPTRVRLKIVFVLFYNVLF